MKLVLLLFGAALAYSQTVDATGNPLVAGLRRVSQSASGMLQGRVLPRIVAGGDWETTVVLFNPGSANTSFQQSFFGVDGALTAFLVREQNGANEMTTSAVKGTLSPKSSLTFVLSSSGGTVREGWSMLTYDAAEGTLNGYAILRRLASGGFTSEVTVPLSDMHDFSSYIRFDNRNGFRSQLTFANPAGNVAANARLTYMDPQGTVVLIDAITVPPAQQLTLTLADAYPDLANKTGTVLIEVDIDRFAVLGLRYNDAMGLIAPLPTMNSVPVQPR